MMRIDEAEWRADPVRAQADTLRKWREDAGYSQQALSVMLKCHRTTLARYESAADSSMVAPEGIVCRIAEICCVDGTELSIVLVMRARYIKGGMNG